MITKTKEGLTGSIKSPQPAREVTYGSAFVAVEV
jgi:hypothetical protein